MFLNLIVLNNAQTCTLPSCSTMQSNSSKLTGGELVNSFAQMINNLAPDQLALWKQMLGFMTQMLHQLPAHQEGLQSASTGLSFTANSVGKIEEEDVLPSRKTRWVGRITPEEHRRKFIEQKTIAEYFIKYGINYHQITTIYPNMEPKTYRCYVEAINNQTVNEIVEFLRYECNMEIERLNRDQKRSIRTQLTKIRDWLGNTNKQQLDIFYAFIRRHYDRKSVTIDPQDALQLYKTILCIIKSPYVNVLSDDVLIAKEKTESGEKVVGSLTEEEAKTAIMLFIKWKDLNKVTDQMGQKFGYDVKYSYLSITNSLKQLLEASVDKLLKSFKSQQMEVYGNCFTPKNIALLHEAENTKIKIDLYSYYLQEKISYVKVKNLAQKLADFFQQNAPEPTISLPKLQLTMSLPKVDPTKKEEPSIKKEAETEEADKSAFLDEEKEVKVEADAHTQDA